MMNDSLPYVIICDLDGTLCKFNGRNPYDTKKSDTDLPNEPVIDVLRQFNHVTSNVINVVFVSGRTDKYRQMTIEWIERYLPFMRIDNTTVGYELHMRLTGDMRDDSIVKRELYEKFIKDRFNVRFVFDDRNKVVKMWRGLGLTCFQVAEGNF